MKQNRTNLFTLFLLVLLISFGCKNTSKNAMPSGVDYNSLNIEHSQVIKTFETARANNKNVLLIFDAVWCGYCRKLNQITLKDAEVKKTLADYEVVNVDVDKYPNVLEAFQSGTVSNKAKGVPLIMIFSSDGLQTDEINGYLTAKPFDRVLKKNL